MSLFQQFDDLRSTVNQLMGDFDSGLRGGIGGSSGGRRRGGRRGRRSDMEMDTGFDVFGFQPFGWGGGFFDEDILDLPLLTGRTTGIGSDIGGSDIGVGKTTAGGVGKEEEEKKMVDVGGEQQVAAPQQGGSMVGTAQSTFKPDQIMRARVNIEDQPDKLIVTADMPGFNKENLKVSVSDDGLLTIKGEQTQGWKDQSKDKKYLRAERSFSNIQRTIRVPKGVDATKIGASYENGVLHVNLPKLPEAEKKQQDIQIQ